MKKFRRGQETAGGPLTLTSWSALEEYLRLNPALVKCIGISEASERRLDESLRSHGLSRAGFNIRRSEQLEVEVSIDWQEEQDLYGLLTEAEAEVMVVCDHVTDTRNLGAIARTCAYFGVRRLIMPKDRQAPISTATLIAAQGAFAFLKPTEVTNVTRFLKKIKDCGFWVVAADMGGKPIQGTDTNFKKMAIVFGSEDKGISALVRETSDLILSVSPTNPVLDSLNVSVAAGIFLHELTRAKA